MLCVYDAEWKFDLLCADSAVAGWDSVYDLDAVTHFAKAVCEMTRLAGGLEMVRRRRYPVKAVHCR